MTHVLEGLAEHVDRVGTRQLGARGQPAAEQRRRRDQTLNVEPGAYRPWELPVWYPVGVGPFAAASTCPVEACTATSEAGDLLVASAASGEQLPRFGSRLVFTVLSGLALLGEDRLDRRLRCPGRRHQQPDRATRRTGELLLERVLHAVGGPRPGAVADAFGPAFFRVSAVAVFIVPMIERAKVRLSGERLRAAHREHAGQLTHGRPQHLPLLRAVVIASTN